MNKKTKVFIIGGYGNVGRRIVSLLFNTGEYIISIGGRNIEKAKAVAKIYDKDVLPFNFNAISYFENNALLLNNDIILSCIDLPDAKLAEFILENGKVYIDLTASYNFMQKIQLLESIAVKNNGLAVLCVGLMPGLSNLMVKHLIQYSGAAAKAEIFVQLGLGEKNGKEAIKWILDNILSEYYVNANGKRELVSPFKNATNEKVFGKFNLFYPFNFADQHIIAVTSNVKEVRSYLGFDIQWFSRYISFLKRIGLLNLLKIRAFYVFTLWFILKVRFGQSGFILKTKVTNEKGEVNSLLVRGNGEASKTALVAYKLICWIRQNRNELQSGITYIENLLSFKSIIDELNCVVENGK